MKNRKKQYQLLGWAFFLLLIFSVVTVIFKGLIGLFPVILSALALGGILMRLSCNSEIELLKKYLGATNLQKELKR